MDHREPSEMEQLKRARRISVMMSILAIIAIGAGVIASRNYYQAEAYKLEMQILRLELEAEKLRNDSISNYMDSKYENPAQFVDHCLKQSIDFMVEDFLAECEQKDTVFHTQNETFRMCTIDPGTELYFVEIRDLEREEFFIVIDNNQLIYALESIRSEKYISWNCRYYILDDEIIDYVSLGHGETEEEGWEPESIFDQWEERKQVFDRHRERLMNGK